MNEVFLIEDKIIEFIPYKEDGTKTCLTCICGEFFCQDFDLLIDNEPDTICSYLENRKYREILEPKEISKLKILGLKKMTFSEIKTKRDLTPEFLKIIIKNLIKN